MRAEQYYDIQELSRHETDDRMRLLLVAVLLTAVVVASPFTTADEKPEPASSWTRTMHTITIDAKIAPRKIDDPRYKEIYPIEVVACWAFPKGQKAHETVVTIEAKPSDVHKGLVELGLKPGNPVLGEKEVARAGGENLPGIPTDDGETKNVPIEKTLVDQKTNKPMPPVKWRFTGTVDAETRSQQTGGSLRRRRHRHAHRHLPGHGSDRLSNELDHEGREIRQTGDRQEAAAQGGHAGQTHHRSAGAEIVPFVHLRRLSLCVLQFF